MFGFFSRSRLKELEERVDSVAVDTRRLMRQPDSVWGHIGDPRLGYSPASLRAVVAAIVNHTLGLDVDTEPATPKSIKLVKRDNEPKKGRP